MVGACSTATHGSGTGNLATQVVALELVSGRGEGVTLSEERNGDELRGAVVGLGAIGLVTKVTLRVVPTFDVRQWVWENMPLAQFTENFDDVMEAGYSVSGFTTWRDDQVSEVWVKRRADDGDWQPDRQWFGATPATRDRHPIVAMDPKACTRQMGVPGPAWERLPHFRPDHPPSSRGRERHSEYFVRRREPWKRFRPSTRSAAASQARCRSQRSGRWREDAVDEHGAGPGQCRTALHVDRQR